MCSQVCDSVPHTGWTVETSVDEQAGRTPGTSFLCQLHFVQGPGKHHCRVSVRAGVVGSATGPPWSQTLQSADSAPADKRMTMPLAP